MKEEPASAYALRRPQSCWRASLWQRLRQARFPEIVLSPLAAAGGLVEEIKTGRLFDDLVVAVSRQRGLPAGGDVGHPAGLVLGRMCGPTGRPPRDQFFRNLPSPGSPSPSSVRHRDAPAVFLIFMASFFRSCSRPSRRGHHPGGLLRVRDYGIEGREPLTKVTLP